MLRVSGREPASRGGSAPRAARRAAARARAGAPEAAGRADAEAEARFRGSRARRWAAVGGAAPPGRRLRERRATGALRARARGSRRAAAPGAGALRRERQRCRLLLLGVRRCRRGPRSSSSFNSSILAGALDLEVAHAGHLLLATSHASSVIPTSGAEHDALEAVADEAEVAHRDLADDAALPGCRARRGGPV